MGCSSTKPAARDSSSKPEKTPLKQDEKKKLNPLDYIISKEVGKAIVKEDGSIDGQQFNVEECKDCDIFLLDNIATSFVDDCEGCRIFIGPIETSVFVRNCKDCQFVIACQQFRCRDCNDCKLALLCTTEPIIETSSRMMFACFDFTYFSLRAQLGRARLNVFNNKWWQVYDFNKNEDRPNWGLLPQEEATQLLRIDRCEGSLTSEEVEMDRVIPITLGSRPWPSEETAFLLFLPGSDAYIEAFMTKAVRSDGWALCRTRSSPLPDERLKTLLAWAKESKLVKQCSKQEITGVQVCGTGVFAGVKEALASTWLSAGLKSIRLVPEAETAVLSKAFFETWKDEV